MTHRQKNDPTRDEIQIILGSISGTQKEVEQHGAMLFD
jgi:hypothetical protein